VTLHSFRVTDQKALHLAECDSVPPLMIVAGPNGVGKSSLLFALKRRIGAQLDDDTQILYEPPHRAIRRQQVRRRWLQASMRGYSELLAGDDVNGFEGLNIQFPQRDPDSVDESGSTLKYTFGRIETRRESALSRLVDEAQESGASIETKNLSDVYAPLKRLVEVLLPHLQFRGISFENEDDIRLTFRILTANPARDVDLDVLSSGEKAVLLLFTPLIEAEINRLLAGLGKIEAAQVPAPDRVFLIDEPEQHLHPELQARVLTYLREETLKGNIQAVVATHSPTLLDLATDQELFVINRPNGDANQLARVADSTARLDALKSLVGNPYYVTTGRTIVLVEGPPGPAGSTDVQLLDRIHPSATKYTFIPMGGRSSVIAAVKALRDQISEARFGISVLGLVDRDRGDPKEEGIMSWPFATIENLLIADSNAVAHAIKTVNGPDLTAGSIGHLLRVAAAGMRDDEVRLRVSEALKPRTIRIGADSVAGIQAAIASQVAELQAESADIARLAELVADAADRVDAAMADRSYRAKFRGKQLLRALLDALTLHNVTRTDFVIALADACTTSRAAQTALNRVFDGLDRARVARLEAVAAAHA
jgi:predicted ATPase